MSYIRRIKLADMGKLKGNEPAEEAPSPEEAILKTPKGEIKVVRTTRSAPVAMQHG